MKSGPARGVPSNGCCRYCKPINRISANVESTEVTRWSSVIMAGYENPRNRGDKPKTSEPEKEPNGQNCQATPVYLCCGNRWAEWVFWAKQRKILSVRRCYPAWAHHRWHRVTLVFGGCGDQERAHCGDRGPWRSGGK